MISEDAKMLIVEVLLMPSVIIEEKHTSHQHNFFNNLNRDTFFFITRTGTPKLGLITLLVIMNNIPYMKNLIYYMKCNVDVRMVWNKKENKKIVFTLAAFFKSAY